MSAHLFALSTHCRRRRRRRHLGHVFTHILNHLSLHDNRTVAENHLAFLYLDKGSVFSER